MHEKPYDTVPKWRRLGNEFCRNIESAPPGDVWSAAVTTIYYVVHGAIAQLWSCYLKRIADLLFLDHS